MKTPANKWPEAAETLLRELWPTHSISEITAQLRRKHGDRYTPKKVSGKASRLGLASRQNLWPEAATEMLVKLWGQDRTCSEIAHALNRAGFGPYTPSAVSGKANRLDVTRRPSPVGIGPSRQDPLTGRENGRQRPIKVCGPHKRCQWPLGDPRDPDFTFCGEAVANGYPYCAEHAARAYQPGTRRDA